MQLTLKPQTKHITHISLSPKRPKKSILNKNGTQYFTSISNSFQDVSWHILRFSLLVRSAWDVQLKLAQAARIPCIIIDDFWDLVAVIDGEILCITYRQPRKSSLHFQNYAATHVKNGSPNSIHQVDCFFMCIKRTCTLSSWVSLVWLYVRKCCSTLQPQK